MEKGILLKAQHLAGVLNTTAEKRVKGHEGLLRLDAVSRDLPPDRPEAGAFWRWTYFLAD